jgi:hypothetical protein
MTLRVAVFLVLLPYCFGASREISKKEFGKDWPLTVDSGTLHCKGSGGVGAVTFVHRNVRYAVNGTARSWKFGKDIDSIWLPGERISVIDPKTKERFNIGPPKKDIGPLIKAGLKLCQ